MDRTRESVEALREQRAQRWKVTQVYEADCQAKMWEVVMCNVATGAIEVTLPTIRTRDVGKSVAIYNDSSSATAITIIPPDGVKIDGSDTHTVAAAWGTVTLVALATTKWGAI